MKTIEFWFEFASTYSYPAAMRIEAAAHDAGVGIVWQPFLLGPIFGALGHAGPPLLAIPEKTRYMWRDLERLSRKYGLPWQQPSWFPQNSLSAARCACSHADAPWLPAFVRGVYQANFADNRDIADPAVLRECLRQAGADADAALALASSETEKPKLRAQGARAQALGLFGAPSFIVDGELFWGHDRLEDALAWAQR